MDIQVTIGDQRGLDVNRLKAVIEQHYVTPAGSPVVVEYGDGVVLPYSYMQIKDRK